MIETQVERLAALVEALETLGSWTVSHLGRSGLKSTSHLFSGEAIWKEYVKIGISTWMLSWPQTQEEDADHGVRHQEFGL